jgi:hypothetical protein
MGLVYYAGPHPEPGAGTLIPHDIDVCGLPMTPCESCGSPVELVDDAPGESPFWAEYHGELTPDTFWHYTHTPDACRARRGVRS